MIFVDSSFWIGLANERDARHAQATALLSAVGTTQLITSDHVLGESWTWIRRRAGHRDAVRFVDGVEASPRLRVVQVDRELARRAWSWLRQHDERGYSFVDATSFMLMRSMKIKDVLAFDGVFSAAGFWELRP